MNEQERAKTLRSLVAPLKMAIDTSESEAISLKWKVIKGEDGELRRERRDGSWTPMEGKRYFHLRTRLSLLYSARGLVRANLNGREDNSWHLGIVRLDGRWFAESCGHVHSLSAETATQLAVMALQKLHECNFDLTYFDALLIAERRKAKMITRFISEHTKNIASMAEESEHGPH